MKHTIIGKALVVMLLFRLFFGGYLMGLDQYSFNDMGSALTVLLLYGLVGILGAFFLLGKRVALLGLLGLDTVFLLLQSVFIVATFNKNLNAGLHDPLSNWWATILMYMFSLLTIVFAFKTYRETTINT